MFKKIIPSFFACLTWSLSAAEQMNVLLIIADDLRPELGCYGAEYMVTPNIDQLAKEGTLFERAYVQQPVCTASRASFLTGLRPDTTGSDYPYSIHTVENLLEGDCPSLLRHFMNQGYYVRGLGKIHHGYYEDFTEKSYSAGYGPTTQGAGDIDQHGTGGRCGRHEATINLINLRVWKSVTSDGQHGQS